MPNKKRHTQIGGNSGLIVGGILNLIEQGIKCSNDPSREFDMLELAGSCLGGLVGGRVGGQLPDIFEPATNPHHRKFFHSRTMGALILTAEYKTSNSRLPKLVKSTIRGINIGYLSHLYLDGETPFGLPNI